MLASEPVAGRPIFHKEFGVFLARLRETRTGWNQSDAARFIKSPLLTRQKLLHLEAGKTQDPDPAVLRLLAAAYNEPYESLIRHLVSSRYGIDWHTAGVDPDDRRGRKEEPSAGRILMTDLSAAMLPKDTPALDRTLGFHLGINRQDAERPHGDAEIGWNPG